MIADRSPGERVDGELAMLKSRRAPLLHARALPKVRMPHPFAALVGTPPISEVVPPAPAPLFNLVAGAPPVIVPVAAIVGPPVILPPGAFFPGGPGGGGGVVVPPTVVTVPPDTPVTPTPQTSGVPEPKSWTMMLIGFALVGGTLRERRRLAS